MRKLLFFLSAFLGVGAYAQGDLSVNATKAASQKVKQLANYIEYMANKNKPYEDRKGYRTLALNLFIERGDSFIQNDEMRKGCIIQITTKYRKKPTERLMKDYFKGLINMKYSKVNIESVNIAEIKVSDLKKVDEHQYECTCYFTMAFCGYRDGHSLYKDITRVCVVCHISESEITGITDNGQPIYENIVLLGDVVASVIL